ncbi:MAG TPA: HGGxSTG domain-containing protein [Microvirga sp.]|nr:HGGxSTG domain-containing protein [Microvirga sp.]
MKRTTSEPESLRTAPRCGARTRAGSPCERARAAGRTRCHLHGGAPGSGAPPGERNGRYRHGRYTAEARAEANHIRTILEKR